MVGSGFREPTAIAVDAEGNVFVVDAKKKGIYKVSPPFAGATHGTISRISDSIVAGGIAAGRDGRIYFTSFHAGSVVEIEKNGTSATIATGLLYPHGIAVGLNGDLYVADGGQNQVKRIARNGRVSDVGSGFYNPWAVAVDSSRNVYVGFSGIARVSPNGTVEPVAPKFDFVLTSLTVDRADDLYVTTDGGIVRIRPNGVVKALTGPPMVDPWGVAVDRSGSVYVSDCDCVGFNTGQGAVWKMSF
jgi:streptogramin lyase